MPENNVLVEAIINMDEKTVITIVQNDLRTREPFEILQDLKVGLTKVGNLFESGEYFFTELVLGADIFKQAVEILAPSLHSIQSKMAGKIIFGTVEGDFHDIGKNIMVSLLRSNGYEVEDLGVDVSPKRFLEKAFKLQPDAIGMSGLLTNAIGPMKTTVALIREKYPKKVLIMVGGQPVNDAWTKEVGADFGTNNAIIAIKMINQRFTGMG